MAFYQGKTAVVTGAAGFIGSHLVDALLQQGATVIGIDNFITGNKNNIAHLLSNANFRFLEADVSTPTSSYLMPETLKPDLVFHFASPASPPGYQKKPVETYKVNVWGTHELLSYLKDTNPAARFLFASTSEIYGDPLEHPQKESYFGNVNPNGERSMYDESKRLGETICGVFGRSFGLDTRIVRIFNTYGPRMDPNDGRSIVDFSVKILKQQPLTIHGDGTQTRSFCYVSDLVMGILSMMEMDSAKGQTINLGNPEEISMNDLIAVIEQVTGKTATKTSAAVPADDPKRRCPDISKAKTILNWQPTIALRDGLVPTIEYFKSLPNTSVSP